MSRKKTGLPTPRRINGAWVCDDGLLRGEADTPRAAFDAYIAKMVDRAFRGAIPDAIDAGDMTCAHLLQ